MLPEQSVDGSAQVLHVPHSAYQAVECAGFRRLEATTPDRRDDDPTGGNCVARWDGVGTLESVGLVGDASAVVSDMVTPTAAVTSQWLAMAVGGVKVIHPSLGGRPQKRRLGDEHPQVLSSQAGQCQVGGALLRTPLSLGAYVPTPPDLLENKQPPIDFCRLRQ